MLLVELLDFRRIVAAARRINKEIFVFSGALFSVPGPSLQGQGMGAGAHGHGEAAPAAAKPAVKRTGSQNAGWLGKRPPFFLRACALGPKSARWAAGVEVVDPPQLHVESQRGVSC